MGRKLWAVAALGIGAALAGSAALAQGVSQGFDVQAATQAYLDSLPAEARAKSDAYFEGGYWLILWGLLWTLGACWLLLGTGLSALLRDWAGRVTRVRFFQAYLYAAGLILALTLLGLPWSIYTDFVREHQYGLSTQSFGAWAGELAIATALSLVLTSLVVAVIYAVVRRSPRRWWIWGTGVSMVFLVISVMVSPVFIAPIFNDYKPLAEGPLRERILAMARANGVPAEEVYMFDASRQTNRVSANVSGMLGTTRVSLNDNLLNRGTPEEVAAVMGHEIGHYALGHIDEMLLKMGAVFLAGFAFVHWAFPRVADGFGRGWGIRGVADPAGAPLALALFSLWFTVMTPVLNNITRSNEIEADIFGLNAAREPDAFATIALKLAEYRKLDPGPLEEFLFYTHPSGRNRIEMAMRWKAEHMKEQAPVVGEAGK